LAEAVAALVARARRFFYAVSLCGYCCPRCGAPLQMEQDGRCECRGCGLRFDPTVAFQCCSSCGGKPCLQVRRYVCGVCGTEVVSRFLFTGLVFDADYFQQKMAEHRERKRKQRERVCQMLAESRSENLSPPAADLDMVPGLADALNELTTGLELPLPRPRRNGFDLKRYQAHIQAHIQPFAISLDEIPPLSENTRIDRIGRFIAIIFLAHASRIRVWQEGLTIMVIQRETD